jgi:hypothetical protein
LDKKARPNNLLHTRNTILRDLRWWFADSSELQAKLHKPEGTWKLWALESHVPGPTGSEEAKLCLNLKQLKQNAWRSFCRFSLLTVLSAEPRAGAGPKSQLLAPPVISSN